ncbi:MAG: hypothetical protein WC996_01630 [Peptostreptococcales bacterium]
MLQRLRKENIYIMIIILVTLVSISIMLHMKEEPNPLSLTSIQANTLSFIDDDALEKFINLYGHHILHKNDFVVTVDNKDNIRRLLNSMGEKNIRQFNNIFTDSNNEDRLLSTQDWLDQHFLPDDFRLLEHWMSIK